MRCEWCFEYTEENIEAVIQDTDSVMRFKLCSTCLNLYAAKEYEELEVRIKNGHRERHRERH